MKLQLKARVVIATLLALVFVLLGIGSGATRQVSAGGYFPDLFLTVQGIGENAKDWMKLTYNIKFEAGTDGAPAVASLATKTYSGEKAIALTNNLYGNFQKAFGLNGSDPITQEDGVYIYYATMVSSDATETSKAKYQITFDLNSGDRKLELKSVIKLLDDDGQPVNPPSEVDRSKNPDNNSFRFCNTYGKKTEPDPQPQEPGGSELQAVYVTVGGVDAKPGQATSNKIVIKQLDNTDIASLDINGVWDEKGVIMSKDIWPDFIAAVKAKGLTEGEMLFRVSLECNDENVTTPSEATYMLNMQVTNGVIGTLKVIPLLDDAGKAVPDSQKHANYGDDLDKNTFRFNNNYSKKADPDPQPQDPISVEPEAMHITVGGINAQPGKPTNNIIKINRLDLGNTETPIAFIDFNGTWDAKGVIMSANIWPEFIKAARAKTLAEGETQFRFTLVCNDENVITSSEAAYILNINVTKGVIDKLHVIPIHNDAGLDIPDNKNHANFENDLNTNTFRFNHTYKKPDQPDQPNQPSIPTDDPADSPIELLVRPAGPASTVVIPLNQPGETSPLPTNQNVAGQIPVDQAKQLPATGSVASGLSFMVSLGFIAWGLLLKK